MTLAYLEEPKTKDLLDSQGKARLFARLVYIEGKSPEEAYSILGYSEDKRNAYRFYRSELVQKELASIITPDVLVQDLQDLKIKARSLDKVENQIDYELKVLDRVITVKGINKQDPNINVINAVQINQEDRAKLLESVKGLVPRLKDGQE